MENGATSCEVEAMPVELFHDRRNPFLDDLVFFKLNIMQDPLDLDVALLHGVALLLDGLKVFFQLVERVDERFTIIHCHFMLLHESLMFFVKNMVVHLQIRELSGAFAEATLKVGKSHSVSVEESVRFEDSV